jgi:hypothetical protein
MLPDTAAQLEIGQIVRHRAPLLAGGVAKA